MSILVVGSVALDDIETPTDSAKGVLGGAACYFSVAASYLAQVRAVGVVGDDFPAEHLDFLGEKGIDTAGIVREPGSTFRWGGRYHASMNQRDTLFTELGVFEGFQPQIPDAYRDSELVFLANIQPTLQLDVLDQVRSPRFVAMDTMNLWIDIARADLEKVLARVDGLVINDEEATLLTGETNLVRAADEIRKLGPDMVIVKRGEHGALLFVEDGVFAAPAFPLRQVCDPTGAGDCFAGGFMGALARAGSRAPAELRKAVIWGSVMASFCCERFGLDRFRSLEAAQTTKRYDEFRALTTF